VCDAFDRAWREGGRPRLEDFLARAPEQARQYLLCELLRIELEYRRGLDWKPGLSRPIFPSPAVTRKDVCAGSLHPKPVSIPRARKDVFTVAKHLFSTSAW